MGRPGGANLGAFSPRRPMRRRLLPLRPLALRPLHLCGLVFALAACASHSGPPCESCGGPGGKRGGARLTSTLRMPAVTGEALVVTGVVTRRGRPAPGVYIYAYQTDVAGRYTPSPGATGLDARHGRLRGWLRTGPDGGYRIETIRPAAYPRFPDPAHIHLTVRPPGEAERWIDDVVFADDPRLTSAWLARQEGRGGPGLTRPHRSADGVWHARRDIALDR